MDSRTLERSDLEGKVLAELQQIAQAVGVENHRMKKSDLIDAILAKASENGQDAAAVTAAGAGEASGNGPVATEVGDATTATADVAAPPANEAGTTAEGSATTESAAAPQDAGGTPDGGATATTEAPPRQEGHGRTGVMERPRRPSREERRRQRELRREREREERDEALPEEASGLPAIVGDVQGAHDGVDRRGRCPERHGGSDGDKEDSAALVRDGTAQAVLDELDRRRGSDRPELVDDRLDRARAREDAEQADG